MNIFKKSQKSVAWMSTEAAVFTIAWVLLLVIASQLGSSYLSREKADDSLVTAIAPMPESNPIYTGSVNVGLDLTHAEFLNTAQAKVFELDAAYITPAP